MQRAMREVGVNGRRVAAAATLAAVVFATAWAGVHLSGYTARIATVWLPNAVVLAVVLRSPRGRWRELLGAAAVACLHRFYENAGLTAFMTKPIDVDLLQQHLARAAGDGKLPQVQLPADESPIDESRLTELRNILGPAKLHSLLEMLGVELSSRPALLRSAAAADRVDDLRGQAHSLKGAVDSLGVVGVARAAKAVELAMPGPELELAMARLDCEVAHARLGISRLLDPPARASRRTA